MLVNIQYFISSQCSKKQKKTYKFELDKKKTYVSTWALYYKDLGTDGWKDKISRPILTDKLIYVL